MKKKVFICTDGIFPHSIGGMQRHSKLLIENLVQFSDLEIHVIHPHGKLVFNNENINEHFVDPIQTNRNYLIECYSYSKRVFEIVKLHPDAILYSQGLSLWYGLKQLKNIKYINPHGLEPYQALSLKDRILAIPFKIIFEFIFRNSDGVISLGGKLTTILNDFIAFKKIKVISNGVSLRTRNYINFSVEPLHFIFVARFASNKGIEMLLDCIKELNKTSLGEKCHFDLVGKGPLYDKLVADVKLSNVTFHGGVSDERLEELYKQAHVFVFPTLFEGMPTVVLEAMAYSLPVIVSDVGAVAEMVNKENGYLLIPGNGNDLLNKMKNFIQLSLEEKLRLSENSFNKVNQDFSWDLVAKKHFNLFMM